MIHIGRKSVALVPAIVALTIVVLKMLAGTMAYSSATSSLNAATGHTVAVVSHGKTIYLTQEQVDREGTFHWSNFLLMGAIGLVVFQHIRQDRHASNDGA